MSRTVTIFICFTTDVYLRQEVTSVFLTFTQKDTTNLFLTKLLKNQKYLEDIFRLKMTEITTSALFVLNFPPIFTAQFALLKK